MRTNPVQAAALEAIAAGLAPIPIVAGERKPLGEWRADQFRPMEAARVPVRFRNGCNIGIACGIGSGGLECIDFDKADLWQPFLDTLEGVNPDLRARLRVWQETPSGGYHLLYRVHGQVAGNQKLASSKPHRGADGILKQDTWIETRGAGGQFVIAPSRAKKGHGKDDGQLYPYRLHGDLASLPTITEVERSLLLGIARSFDEGGHRDGWDQPMRSQCQGAAGDRPGDRFNRETDWSSLLTSYGWKRLKITGDREHWQRPGKTGPDTSATLHQELGFWCFSSSTPLPTQKPLTPFAVFAYMEHNGDFGAAAKTLAARYCRTGPDRQRHDRSTTNEDCPAPTGHHGGPGWEEPVSLDQPTLPVFTCDDFPHPLWQMIEGIARATETPPELAGMSVLAVAATACQGRLLVELDPGYTEPLNLWSVTALPPGSRKSAVQKIAIRPLEVWEIERGQALEAEIRAAKVAREAGEMRLKELQKRYAKETNEAERATLQQEIETAEMTLVEIPRKPRVFAQDVTPEHLGTMLADNGERLSIFSSEGGIFDTMAGRYAAGIPNLDIFLQAHSGDPVRVDRGTRASVYMKEPALSMGLSVQPDVLQAMASKKGFRGRGLVGRFLYAMPTDLVGRRTLETIPIAPYVMTAYEQTISTLLDMVEVRNRQTGELLAIYLDDEAHASWKVFARWVEGEMAAGGSLEHMRDFAGKLPGTAGRIAGVFHCVEHADRLVQDALNTPDRYNLSGRTMEMALSLARKLAIHAIHVYGLMGEGDDVQAARHILAWIRRTGCGTFSARGCHRALRTRFPKRADLDPGLNILEEHGYIRRHQQPVDRVPGRPSLGFMVNPCVHAR